MSLYLGGCKMSVYVGDVLVSGGGPTYGFIDLLVVGGGGDGGGGSYGSCYFGGGGGGGGGVIVCNQYPLNTEYLTYNISVGCKGDSSCFGDIVGLGGGHGHCGCDHSGGNGGGGTYICCKGGTGLQGYNGGDTTSTRCSPGGGGGGAGGAGCSSTAWNCPGGNGGEGLLNDFSGQNVYYGAGGGGGAGCGTWGSGGGIGGTGGGNGGGFSNECKNGCNATCYGAGGGGGAGYNGGGGGSGCQGIVIVRYKTDGSCGILPTSSGGCKYSCGDYTIHCFTKTGTTQLFTPVFK